MWLVIGMAAAKEAPTELRKVDGITYYPADKKVEDPEKRCFVDLRLPENAQNFPTLVWFHGGGLTGGKREFPKFEGRGVALVAAGYRQAGGLWIDPVTRERVTEGHALDRVRKDARRGDVDAVKAIGGAG